ncbi:MAG: arsenate reductase ArsC [Rhodothermales bacterium]|nr:arsenate reductase ArsC [Rhodothermales bacterium]
MSKPRVLFVCTHNSARSQMAEGWLRHLAGDRFVSESAGTEPRGVNPLAVEAMREVGVDLTGNRSEHVDEYVDPPADYVITVCDHAKEVCPYVPAAIEVMHKGFDDPSSAMGSHAERLAVFRRVRDEIREWIEATFVQEGTPKTSPQ